MNNRWQLVMPEQLFTRLHAHLFPGDGDEHGAVILAGMARSGRGVRLLARAVHLAVDGEDFVPGDRGYRKLRAEFVAEHIFTCRDQRLVYLAVHNHGGTERVAFSRPDLDSHERGYPALLDIVDGLPVGALVFAEGAVASDIWLPGRRRVSLEYLTVVGRSIRHLREAPRRAIGRSDLLHERQARLLGEQGQDLLRAVKVGVVGAGGVGSIVVELLARLGVGEILVIDLDRVETSNLSRLVGAPRFRLLRWLTEERRAPLLRALGRRIAPRKAHLAARQVRRAGGQSHCVAITGDFVDESTARRFSDCDYLFLAADTMQARLVFNAMVHQYLIPGVQIGAKAAVDPHSGQLEQVFSVVRPVRPDSGCLLCNGVISAAQLQREAETPEERRLHQYVDEPEVRAPSVVSLNAVAASLAVNDFLFAVTGLTQPDAEVGYTMFYPLTRGVFLDTPAAVPSCPECSVLPSSRLARGDARRLPVRVDRPGSNLMAVNAKGDKEP